MQYISINQKKDVIRIDATSLHYKVLNELILEKINEFDAKKIEVLNVIGQRYIGSGIHKEVDIDIYGIPGNDLASFMNGPTIRVYGNVQDGVCNTMNYGKVVVNGEAGDVLCYGMRGGKLFVKGNVGYRVCIHMKEYKDFKPKVVVGGTAGDFFGEYMAGGILVLLGLTREKGQSIVGDYCATGMHGGVIYIRGEVEEDFLGKEVRAFDIDENDRKVIESLITEFCDEFPEYSVHEIVKGRFIKLIPVSSRPYGRIYSYGGMHKDQLNYGEYTILECNYSAKK